MEWNSENTTDANNVHLEGNILFLLFSLLLKTKMFDQSRIVSVY